MCGCVAFAEAADLKRNSLHASSHNQLHGMEIGLVSHASSQTKTEVVTHPLMPCVSYAGCHNLCGVVHSRHAFEPDTAGESWNRGILPCMRMFSELEFDLEVCYHQGDVASSVFVAWRLCHVQCKLNAVLHSKGSFLWSFDNLQLPNHMDKQCCSYLTFTP